MTTDYIETLADALGAQVAGPWQGKLLELARDVAHGTERKNAPLATFLTGIAVGRGAPLDEALATARSILGDEPGGPPAS